ncbi:HCL320Wp [Eremothecium sinecaudum]|uniref:HCL320Wp n=1 Tax=Eremothecium sinecaudum TaxID=45286 RepID=A0A120K1Y4_9SACH|nr:HCL320Wp [Eremothecium sinecaudum]AMD19831.1 HCL320Wp [Eremothecium sinecaudum]
MIGNQFVVTELDSITHELELKLFSHLSSASGEYEYSTRGRELERENNLLQLVKHEVDTCVNSINDGKDKYVVRYDRIIAGLKALQRDDFTVERAAATQGESLMRNGITDYLNVLVYHTLVVKNLEKLPVLLADQLYYQQMAGSRWYNKLIFGLCEAPKKAASFIKENKWEELPAVLQRLVQVRKLQIVGIPLQKAWYSWDWYRLPVTVVEAEIAHKLNLLETQLNQEVANFGQLVHDFPRKHGDRLPTLSKFLGLDPDSSQLEVLCEVEKWDLVSQAPTPSRTIRYWPSLLLLLVGGPSAILNIWNSRYEIANFLKRNLFDFTRNLITNWIVEPIQKIWSTVRHDPNSSIALMSQGTLDAEVGSLQRMIVDFVREHESANTMDTESLLKEVEIGNLTRFLEIYEAQIRKPVRNIVKGDLIRSLLIQIQKGKVDSSIAIHGIDQLLKSQQLVFGIVSLSPALLLFAASWVSLDKLIRYRTIFSKQSYYRERVSMSLNNVERLLNYSSNIPEETVYYNIGLLTLEMAIVRQMGSKFLPQGRMTTWYRDIDDLVNARSLDRQGKLNVINRIYHIYGRYL